MPPPLIGGALSDDAVWRLSVAYIMNIHGAHSYWKQGVLGAAGVRRVWAGAGPQRAAYRGGGISCGLALSLFILRAQIITWQNVLFSCIAVNSSIAVWMKKALRATQTLRAGCSKAEPKIFNRRRPLPGGAGRPKFNQLERVTILLPTNPVWWGWMHAISSYRDNRPTRKQVNKHSHTQTHRQDRLQYTAPLS